MIVGGTVMPTTGCKCGGCVATTPIVGGGASEVELWDTSVPCSTLRGGTRGELDRTKTVAAIVVALEASVEGRVVGREGRVGGGGRVEGRRDGRVDAVVEGIRCWVVTIVGVT